ncbi:MAG: amidohydrolase family protein [Desulfurococcales archaeon]|nr:amidohydrolase family protein [Desulfurococcales archaeon]
MTTLVYRGLVYDVNGLRKATIVVKNGYIEGVHDPGYSIDADIELDYRRDRNVIAFPGFIDIHVHLRDFKQSYKETIESGTRAALRGGVTVVGEMPNTIPAINNTSVLAEREKILERDSRVDYYIYIGLPETSSELDLMIKDRVVGGLKIYPKNLVNRDLVAESLSTVSRIGKVVVLHPEHPMLTEEPWSMGEASIVRGVDVEAWGIRSLGYLVEKTGVDPGSIHVTHITSPVSLLEAWRYGFSVDTCPHYLLFSIENTWHRRCLGKVYPPLRNIVDQRELFSLLQRGFIGIVSSDHAPHHILEKTMPYPVCPGGINGIEITAPFMGTLVSLKYISLDQMYRLLSLNPSRLLGLRRYGVFCRGCRGNLSIIRFNTRYLYRAVDSPSKPRYSIYDGYLFHSRVEATVIGGRLGYIYDTIYDGVKGMPVGVVEHWMDSKLL